VKKLLNLFKNNIIIPISIISLALLLGLFYYMPKATMENTIQATTKNSGNLVKHMRIFRSYYTKKILSKVKSQTDLKINYDHDIKNDTIPLPATSIHDLGRLFTQNTDTKVRMYSNFPFPNRKDRKLDDFEKESLEYFKTNSNGFFSRQEKLNGEEVFRYAVPDFLTSKGCVNCHNQRADTPKNNWKLGDVRGAIEIITPITSEIAANNEMKYNILIFISTNIAFLIIYYSFISINRKKEMQKMSEDFEKTIKEQTQKLSLTSSVFENATEGITICDPKNIITSVNQTFTKITGYTKEDVIGKHISIMKSGKQDKTFYENMWKSISKKGYWEGEITNKRKNGELYDEILHISAIKSEKGEISHFIAVFSDISDKRETQESIYNLAHFDSLTKIANRNFFQKKLAMSIKELKADENIALMYIDLDRFKIINDSLGHNIGDDLLLAVAKRISRLLDSDDFFARLGGDEFAIFFQSSEEIKTCEEKIATKADKIINSLNEVFEIKDNQLSIGSSIGITLYPRDANNIEELMQYVDTAMYNAKDNGRNRYTIYTGDIAKEAKYKYKIEQELRSAMKNGEITLVYQPIVNSKNSKIEGFEVLSRWIHEELGFVSPELFISIAEERGMIANYTYDLLELSCSQTKKWNQKWNQNFYVSVNISPVHFLQNDLVENISKILEKTKLPASLLKLEITEGVIIENKELVISTLKRFRKMGIKISIDDFGTGYSSISYLKNYPIDFLKIDRSFITDTPFDMNNKNICQTIVSLAKNFNLAIIAEGVETDDNVKFLKNIDVEYLQGYYFSKPENSEYWDNFLREDARKKIEKKGLELV